MIVQSLAVIAAGSGGLWWKMRRNKKQAEQFSGHFRTWLQTEGNVDHDVKAWIEERSSDEFKALTTQVIGQCEGSGLQLDWLWGTALTHPGVADTLKETVNSYLRSRVKGGEVQEDIDAFKAFQALEKRPNSKANQALAGELFDKLVEAGAASPATSELLEGPRKKRREYMMTSIRQAATDSSDTFYAALKDVLASQAAAAAETAEATDSTEEDTPEPVGVASASGDEPAAGEDTEPAANATYPYRQPSDSSSA